MKNQKLIRLLASFSDFELEQLEKYIQLLGKSDSKEYLLFKRTITLGYLDKYRVGTSLPSKFLLWNAVYPDSKYDWNTLRKLMSRLCRIIEHYIIWKNLEAEPELEKILLAKGYSRLCIQNETLRTDFESKLKAFSNQLSTSKIGGHSISAEVYYLEYCVHTVNYQHNNHLGKRAVTKSKDYLECLTQSFDSISKYYYLIGLKLLCEQLFVYGVNDSKFIDPGQEQDIISKAKNFDIDPQSDIGFGDDFLFRLYFAVYRSAKDCSNKTDLNRLICFFRTHSEKLSEEENVNLGNQIQNLLIIRINNSRNEGEKLAFQKQLNEIYSHRLANKSILFQGQLSPWDFKNIISNFIALDEIDLGFLFVKKWKRKLINTGEIKRAIAVKFALGHLYYKQGNLGAALTYLLELHKKEPDRLFALDSRSIGLKAKWESINWKHSSSQYEDLEDIRKQLEAYNRFLDRSVFLSPNRKETHKRKLFYFKKILNLFASASPRLKYELQNIINSLVDEENLHDKEYLTRFLMSVI